MLRACSTRPPGGRFEDVRQERRLDADAGVGDDQRVVLAVAAERHRDAAARRRELHRVREQVPDHLLQPIGIAERRAPLVEPVASIVNCRDSADGRIDSTAAWTSAARSTGRRSRRSLPVVMRETSSRSSTSRACAWALRSIFSSARNARGRDNAPDRSSRVQPRMALSGVRSSCDSVARNSSFSRLASRSSASRCWIWREHAVERLDQRAELVVGHLLRADRVVAARRHLGGGARQLRGSAPTRASAAATTAAARRPCATSSSATVTADLHAQPRG